MKVSYKFLVCCLFSIGFFGNGYAIEGGDSFTLAQVRQVEQIIHNYLVKNPGVLVEASTILQKKEATKQQAEMLKIVPKHKELFDTEQPGKFIVGNADAKIVVTEFFNYQCSHCKLAEEQVEQLLKKRSDIQVIFAALPVFGNDSVYTAKAVLAAKKQGKALELHRAFIHAKDYLNQESADKIIAATGINVQKLKMDMNDSAIESGLKLNIKLAQDIKINGTPTFIFANRALTKFSFIQGHTSKFAKDMQQALADVR